MSLNLKHIPCPAGNKCDAFQCIFGHDKDKTSAQAQAPAQVPAEAQAAPVGSFSSESSSPLGSKAEPPRKRPRLGDEVSETKGIGEGKKHIISPAGHEPTDKPGSDTSNTTQPAPAVTLSTTTRPISPPPRRRATAINPHQPSITSSPTSSSANASGSAKKTASSTPAGKGKTAREPATTKTAKAESLNPRLLKSSPASHEIRLKLLRLLHTEYARLNKELKRDANDDEEKLLLSDQQLIKDALDEEQTVATGKGAVYSNMMKNKVMHYKRMNVAQWKQERQQKVSASSSMEGAANGSSDQPKKIETGLTPSQEVQLLKRILTPINNLSRFNYVPAVPSEAAVKAARDGLEASHGWQECDRCSQRFQVFPGRREEDGALTSGGTCRFHWGKLYYPNKRPGEFSRSEVKRYRCCHDDVGTPGCFNCDHHVFKVSSGSALAATLNFAETPRNELVPADRAVGFDCEMGYTVHGMELIRLTAVSWPDGEKLLDVLVRPLGEILDLNTRYSGVSAEDMARAKPWFEAAGDSGVHIKSGAEESGSEEGEVRSHNKGLKIVSSPEIARDLLFSLIDTSTPLIGHGLENDLNAVRMVHPTVIDTVLLYPHKGGLPLRNGLKMLMDHHLNRKIQQENSEVQGHDSAEDARAAGDLVRLKVATEWGRLQRAGWRLSDGQFLSPTGSNAL